MTRTLALLLFAAIASAALAGPNDKNDQEPIAKLDTADGNKLYEAVAAEYVKQLAAVTKLFEADQQQAASLRRMRALGRANSELSRLYRVAGQLILAGEPAGVDFQLRTRQLQKTNSTMVKNYRAALRTNTITAANLPAASQEIVAIRNRLAKTAPARLKLLKEVQAKINQKMWLAAETQLFQASEQLRTTICFLTGMEANEVLVPFQTLAVKIAPPLETIRRQAANGRLISKRRSIGPEFSKFTGFVETTTRKFRQSGKVPIDGKQLDGPQLVEFFGKSWRFLHWRTSQCRALEWARCALLLKPNTAELLDLETKLSKLPQTLGQAFAEIIKADAAKINAADVPARHAAYLAVLAPLQSRCNDRRFAAAVEPALRELAAKQQAFAAEVADYERMANELLRWRKRLAASQAAQQKQAYPSAQDAFVEACRSRPNMLGLFPENRIGKEQETPPELRGSAPAIANMAKPKLLNKPIAVGPSVGLDNADLAMSQYDRRVWASFSKPTAALNLEIAKLKSDMLVGKHPPLSLKASAAIASARQSDLIASGGIVSGFHLESLICRFGTLPQAAWAIHPLGALPLENIGQTPFDKLHPQPLRQMMIRFELKPKWMQHEYFFVRIGAP